MQGILSSLRPVFRFFGKRDFFLFLAVFFGQGRRDIPFLVDEVRVAVNVEAMRVSRTRYETACAVVMSLACARRYDMSAIKRGEATHIVRSRS